jgi:hypothetical protein
MPLEIARGNLPSPLPINLSLNYHYHNLNWMGFDYWECLCIGIRRHSLIDHHRILSILFLSDIHIWKREIIQTWIFHTSFKPMWENHPSIKFCLILFPGLVRQIWFQCFYWLYTFSKKFQSFITLIDWKNKYFRLDTYTFFM